LARPQGSQVSSRAVPDSDAAERRHVRCQSSRGATAERPTAARAAQQAASTLSAAARLCSGPGWQQRRGQAAPDSLRAAAERTGGVEFKGGRKGYMGLTLSSSGASRCSCAPATRRVTHCWAASWRTRGASTNKSRLAGAPAPAELDRLAREVFGG
jgi:hypothetical protein